MFSTATTCSASAVVNDRIRELRDKLVISMSYGLYLTRTITASAGWSRWTAVSTSRRRQLSRSVQPGQVTSHLVKRSLPATKTLPKFAADAERLPSTAEDEQAAMFLG